MKRTIKGQLKKLAVAVFVMLATLAAHAGAADYLSPTALIADPAGQTIYVADYTANQVQQLDVSTAAVTKTFQLPDAPTGLALSSDAASLYVTAGSADGAVFVIDLATGAVADTISVGHTPMAPVLNGGALYICNRFEDSISVIDLATKSEVTVDVAREPVAAALTPDSASLVVANHLPYGPANIGYASAIISVISTATNTVTSEIPLPNGATGLRGICISPDGRFAYVTHILGRYQVPAVQIERGWAATNAISIIDLPVAQLLNTVLLDDIDKGAANPWAIQCTTDGQYLCATHAGTHELSVIDLPGLHQKLQQIAQGQTMSFSQSAADVPDDLGFLSGLGLRRRVRLSGNGPRDMTVIANKAYVAEYFTDTVCVVNIPLAKTVRSIALGPQNPLTVIRQGEVFFNDAQLTFQQWLTCASCHPDIRTDALNWDLGNDGLGSPRNAKPLLLSHMTPPTTVTGCRADAETSVRAGFKFIEFAVRPEEDSIAVDEYLKSLRPLQSPYLVEGRLSPAAQRGQQLFKQAKCADCHSGQFFTDMQPYDVGTGRGAGEELDPPSLAEIWRTAPYLQDGRAATMEEVLTTYNPEDKHGLTSNLSPEQIQDLTEYVLSISASNRLGDFDNDGDVDLNDFSILAAAWSTDHKDPKWNPICDIATPLDNSIDAADLAPFVQNWLAGTEESNP